MVFYSKLSIAATGLLASYVSVTEANKLVKEIILSKKNEALKRGDYIEDPALRPDSVLNDPQACMDGTVTVGNITYECNNIDFLSFVAYKDMEIKNRPHEYEADSADIWGWESPSGMEVTILSMDNGIALVDTTEPTNPCIIAKLPTNLQVDIWADVKVHDNTLYHVKDTRLDDAEEVAGTNDIPNPTPGLEIWDLMPFDKVNCHAEGYKIIEKEADNTLSVHGRAHNLVVNREAKRLYAVGTRPQACNAGFVAYDISDRMNPEFLGCADDDGYTHDGQCVLYTGPDKRYEAHEICFAFNEDTLTIWDVTDMKNVIMVSRTYYLNQAYSHQGWLTHDMTKILLDDELDELCNDDPGPYISYCERLVHSGLSGLTTTSTDIFDVTDLQNPVVESVLVHDQKSIDHNLYVWGWLHKTGNAGGPAMKFHPDPNYAILNNYMAGIRIVDIHDADSTKWKEVAFFDVNDGEDKLEFQGSWSGYLHPSGAYAVSSIELGLFMIRPKEEFIYNKDFPRASSVGESNEDEPLLATKVVVGIMVGLIAFGAIFAAILIVANKKQIAIEQAQQSGKAEPEITNAEEAKAAI